MAILREFLAGMITAVLRCQTVSSRSYHRQQVGQMVDEAYLACALTRFGQAHPNDSCRALPTFIKGWPWRMRAWRTRVSPPDRFRPPPHVNTACTIFCINRAKRSNQQKSTWKCRKRVRQFPNIGQTGRKDSSVVFFLRNVAMAAFF